MEPPPRPVDASSAALGFDRKPMVSWLSPRGLTVTGMRVLLSGIFGAYSDKRELQAALQESQPFDYSGDSDLWIDYISDLGDGFNPTYHLAKLLAEDKLELESIGETLSTPKAKILVMGGDQVYPAASKDAYEDRLTGPYRAASPWSYSDRHLYAIPGNHDWYDGLTSFIRVFCQKDWVGGWRTHQNRSYFALQLPHRWWLWGIDIQFDNYIDEPQLLYFDQVVGPRLEPGDSIILCSAKPAWVKCNLDHPEAYVNLDYFDRKFIRRRGAEVRLFLTGDSHHYARYEDVDEKGCHLITAGGGGAYLAATHHQPEELELPPGRSRDPGKTSPARRFRLKALYPDRRKSLRMRRGILALPFQNVGFWALVAGIQVVFAWLVATSLRGRGVSVAELLSDLTIADIARDLLRSTLGVTALVVLLVCLAAFTQALTPAKRWVLGGAHTLVQLLVATFSIRGAAWLLQAFDGPFYWVAFFALVGVGGGFVGTMLVALYLYVADHFGCNTNELFAAQRIEDYKCFLRLHLDERGDLTLYPVKVEKVCKKWQLRTDGEPHEPWFEPAGAHTPAQLIEPPIRVQSTSKAREVPRGT